MLQVQKQLIKNADHEAKMIERTNFFPFTHGDTIEKQRVVLSELQKEELAQTLRERSKKINDAYGERHLKAASLNVTANASLMQPRLGETAVITTGSNIDIDPEAHPSCDFVKNHSFQRSRMNQPHIAQDTRDGAVLNPAHTGAMEAAM